MIRNVPMKILLTADQRRMLEWLAKCQRRSMNNVIGVAIERIYQAEERRIAEGAGFAITKRQSS